MSPYDFDGYPPTSWLTTQMTVDEFEKEFGDLKGDPNFTEFANLQKGDKLWRFMSPKEDWDALAGRGGIALVRHGRVIAHILTIMS